MKKNIILTAIAFTLATFIGCKKDENINSGTVDTGSIQKLVIAPEVEILYSYSTLDGLISRGVCWSTSKNPTIQNDKTIDAITNQQFSSKISNIKPKTTYYLRAYLTTNTGTIYGTERSFTTADYSYGQELGGGKIFYIDSTGKHGLIASPTNNGEAVYGAYGFKCGASGIDIGTGKSNTDSIFYAASVGQTGASICKNLNIGGFTDWFLPSRAEMQVLNKNGKFIDGWVDGNYLTSTEESIYGATYCIANSSSPIQSGGKNEIKKVRAIRSF